MLRLVPLSACLALCACAVGNRGLETEHQPLVDGATAYVPGCPDWDHGLGGERETQSANFGCAASINLAAMIADPNDLLRGHGDATPAEVASRAIKAWREISPTSKNWVVTVSQSTKGN